MSTSVLSRLFKRTRTQTVMNHRIAEPRLTLWAALWVLVYLALPVFVLGMLVDVLIQGFTGYCTGVWCYFQPPR